MNHVRIILSALVLGGFITTPTFGMKRFTFPLDKVSDDISSDSDDEAPPAKRICTPEAKPLLLEPLYIVLPHGQDHAVDHEQFFLEDLTPEMIDALDRDVLAEMCGYNDGVLKFDQTHINALRRFGIDFLRRQISTFDVINSLIINQTDITDAEFLEILDSRDEVGNQLSQTLTSINFEWCPRLHAPDFSGLKSLNSLLIKECPGLMALDLTDVTKLRTLNISHCRNLDSINILDLRNVREIHLRWCKNLDTENLIGITSRQTLYIEKCKKISPKQIKKAHRGIKIFVGA